MYGNKLRSHTVGTGPFILKNKDINEDVELRLVKNPNYWEIDNNGNELPYLDIIKIKFNSNKKIELANFRKGNLDMVYQLPVEELDELLVSLDSAKNGGNPEYILQSNKDDGLSISYYCFNMLNPLFQKSEIRKAFNLAIDREKITKYSLHGEAEAALNGLVPGLKNSEDNNIQGFEYNPKTARELLAKSGYPNGEGFPEIELDISESNYLNKIVAESIQKMLYDNLGIKIKVNYQTLSSQIDKFTHAKSDFWGMIWLADYPDPQNFLQLFNGAFVPEEGEASYTNASRYNNPIFDKFYFEAIHAKTQESAMDNYFKADSVLISDAAFIPIYYEHKIRLLQNNVRGLPINSMEHRDFTRVFLSKE
jgi:peptide/nickel transport system substrate-binding protein